MAELKLKFSEFIRFSHEQLRNWLLELSYFKDKPNARADIETAFGNPENPIAGDNFRRCNTRDTLEDAFTKFSAKLGIDEVHIPSICGNHIDFDVVVSTSSSTSSTPQPISASALTDLERAELNRLREEVQSSSSSSSAGTVPESISSSSVDYIIEALTVVTEGLGRIDLNRQLINVNIFPPLSPIEVQESADKLFTIAPNRLEKLCNFLSTRSVSLLRSPPRSGKTSLCYILEASLRAKGHEVYRISLLEFDPTPDETFMNRLNDFLAEKQRKYGHSSVLTWNELLRSKAFILIDEAQKLYFPSGTSDPISKGFWDSIKVLQTDSKSNTHLFLIGTYGHPQGNASTPIEILPENCLSLVDLRLTFEEHSQLVERYCKEYPVKPPSEMVQKMIFNATAGYPGLVRRSLHILLRDSLQPWKYQTEVDQVVFLWSPYYTEALEKTRALSWIPEWNPTDEEIQFLRYALNNCDRRSAFKMPPQGWSPDQQKFLIQFLKRGLFIEVRSATYEFALPLLRMTMARRLTEAPIEPTSTFEEFLLRSIERMSSKALRDTYSIGTAETSDSAVLERQWQNEFYRAASTVIPKEASVSPDASAIFLCEGEIDYYVNGRLRWGVELLREGVDMKGHLKRFDDEGMYSSILPHLREWVILDFRKEEKRVYQKAKRERLWHVCYNEDFTKVTIRRAGLDDFVIKLRGDTPSTPSKFDQPPPAPALAPGTPTSARKKKKGTKNRSQALTLFHFLDT